MSLSPPLLPAVSSPGLKRFRLTGKQWWDASRERNQPCLHGDARAVLRALAESGPTDSARLVYADPPYNTRRSERRPFRDHRTDGDWPELIRSVAEGSRMLLREDGSFGLQVNDRQLGLARVACDAVFGSGNYVGAVVWERTRRPSYLHGELASTLDFLLVYARRRTAMPPLVSGVTGARKRVPLAHREIRLSCSGSRREASV
ncbi:DNA methyltransferase [Arthrobacter sp. zg-Y1171]|uniref:DNA methyltransferase n=1 Tax=Arthrobacter sp. zg-Y1171 TaxID=2964610 RepID=UPI0035B278AB